MYTMYTVYSFRTRGVLARGEEGVVCDSEDFMKSICILKLYLYIYSVKVLYCVINVLN